MSVNTTSPTIYGEVPEAVTEVGGVVLDLVGVSGARVVAQLSASSLFEGFFNSTVGTIGTLNGLTQEVIDALGGGISEVGVRLTVRDADTASGNFDFNQNWLQVGGIRIGNFSNVTTYITDGSGNVTSGPRAGFGDNTLDTGWFYNNNTDTMAQLYDVLQTTVDEETGLIFGLEDVDPGDNFFDFKQGLDGGLIDIGSFNVVPVANDDTVTFSEDDAPTAIDVRANDVDSGPFVVDLIDGIPADQIITLASGATLELDEDGNILFSQNGAYQDLITGQSASEEIVYQVIDPQDASDIATLTITIEGADDAPDARADQFTTNEDASEITGNLFSDNGNGVDEDVDAGASFTVTAIDGQSAAVGQQIALGAGLLTVSAAGDLRFEPNQGYEALAEGGSAQEQFTYDITDNTGLTSTATVTLTIEGRNDAPVAGDDQVGTFADEVLSFDPRGNDVDPEVLPLTITAIDGQTGPITLASGAVVSVAPGGGLSYDPNGAFTLAKGDTASDSFTYEVTDSAGATSSATVSVTVTGPNTVPIAVDDAASVAEDGSVQIDVLGNDTDADADDSLSATLVTGPSNGSVQQNVDGSFTYTPNANYNGTDSFTYSASDGTDEATATVTLTITPEPDAPSVANDTATTETGTPVDIAVLTNDTDPEGDTFLVTGVGEAMDGTVTFDGNTVTYTPLNGFVGTDSFTYTVTDSSGESATATATVTVTPGPQPDIVATAAALPDGQSEDFATASWTVSNDGAAILSDTVIERLWLSADDVLSSDDILLRTLSFSGDLDPGDSIERSARITLPEQPGDYRLIVELDPEDVVSEESEANNIAVSDLLTVSANYTAAILGAPTSAISGESFTVSGRAVDTSTGDGEAFEFVTVELVTGGIARSFNAFTDADGFFDIDVDTLPGSAGATLISARHPGVPEEDSSAEALVNVFGMGFTRERISTSVAEGGTVQATLTLENFSALDISGLTPIIDGVAEGLSASIVSAVPTTLDGDAALAVTLDINADAGTALPGDDFTVSFSSTEGASASADVSVSVIQLVPQLAITEGDLSSAIVLGDQTLLTVEVTNIGGAATGDLEVSLPAGIDFLSLVNADLPSLDAGESFDLTFSLTPDDTVPLGNFEGALVVSSVDAQILVPFDFITTSSETGALNVSLVSEKTFLTETGEKVQDATVTIRDFFTNAVVASATDVDGDISFPDLTAGIYRVDVRSDGHDSSTATIEVLPGRTVEFETFMSEQTVSYTWSVEEIAFEDRYVVEIESTFTTNVPQPVVVLEPAVIDVFDLDTIGDEKTINLTVTNEGLITAQNLNLNLGSHPWYEIEPLIDGLSELDAKSSVTIPVRVVRTGDENSVAASTALEGDGTALLAASTGIVGGGAASSAGFIPCFINGLLSYEFPCADYTVGKALGISYANVEGNCGTPFSFRPPPRTVTSGDGGIPVVSLVPATSVIDVCDLLRVIFDCAPLLPLPPHVQLALQVADFLTFGTGLPAPSASTEIGFLAASRGLKRGIDALDDFDDFLDDVLPIVDTISQAGACITAVGNFLGDETITDIGETVQGVGDAAGDILGPINDIVDPLDDLLEGDIPFLESIGLARNTEAPADMPYSEAFVEAFQTVKQAYRDFIAAQDGIETATAALGIEDEARALRDALQDLVDTGELTETEEAGLRENIADLRGLLFTIDQLGGVASDTFAVISDIELLAELGEVFLGGDVWIDNMDDARVKQFYQDFFDMMRASFDEDTLLTEAQRTDLLSRELPDEITLGDREALFDLWFDRLVNNGTDDETSQVFQDATSLNRLLDEIATAEDTALANGYASLTDSINDRLSTADDAANALGAPPPGAACAQVRLSIQQDVALTRQGFVGSLEIDNVGPTALSDVEIVLQIRDADGNLVEENVFGVFDPVIEGLTGIDGAGILASGQNGSVEFTILPSRLAAPVGPTEYTIGGTLSYTENGVTVTADLTREPVTVLPQPELQLDYFQSRDVFGDDPFTDEIEDAVPFSLGVRVTNAGPGEATDLSIASAQPKIIENEKGLLVDFSIIGASVNGEAIQPTLLADFGDLGAGETAQAVWSLQSSLQGVFSDYSASFRHVNGLGNEDLSLITDVTIRELVHVVDAGLPSADDGRPDFLVNDIADTNSLPDRVYFSEGGDADVTIGLASSAGQSGGGTSIEVAQQGGWFYANLIDPLSEEARIASVQRVEIDGEGLETVSEFNLDNLWQTDRTFTEGGVAIYEDRLHFFDHADSAGTITYRITLENSAPDFAPAEDIYVIAAPGAAAFTALATDADGDALTYSLDSDSAELFDIDAGTGEVALRSDVDIDSFLFSGPEERSAVVDLQVSASDGTTRTEQTFSTTVLRDSDGDGVQDIGYLEIAGDNAIDVANPDQIDSNGDGYGNIIDQDLDDDGLISFTDFSLLASVFNQPAANSPLAAAADFDGNGTVDFGDYQIFIASYGDPMEGKSWIDLAIV